MPVYEYRCSECNTKFDIFHKSSENKEEVICPKCSSKESKKVFSSFSSSIDGNTNNFGGSNDSSSFSGGGCASGMCGLN